MKVLHYVDCESLSWLGPYVEHIKLLAKLGAEPALICRPGGRSQAGAFCAARDTGASLPGGDIERAALDNDIPVSTWRPFIAAVPRLSPGFVSLVRSISPDVIHTRLSSAARIAGCWRRVCGVPVIATFDKPAKAKYYRNIDQFISCAEWLKRYMSEREGIDAGKIDVVHNSVDLSRFSRDSAVRRETRRTLGISDEDIVFAGMGIYIHRKGFDILIKAFAELCRERRSENLRLALIGGGGESGKREEYLRLAGELGVADRLIMPASFLQDARPWLWASDIFVMPSRAEGFSIALLEGMAAGLPVIASDIEPFTEIVKDDLNGLTAAKDNVSSFVSAMRLMLDAGDMGRERFAENARDILERNFTPMAAARKTMAVYEKTIRSA